MLREAELVGAGNLDGTIAVIGGGPAKPPATTAAVPSNKEAGTVATAGAAAAAAAASPLPAAAAAPFSAAPALLSPADAALAALAPGACTPRRKADGARCQADAECLSGWCGLATCDGSTGSCGGACGPRPPTLSAAPAAGGPPLP